MGTARIILVIAILVSRLRILLNFRSLKPYLKAKALKDVFVCESRVILRSIYSDELNAASTADCDLLKTRLGNNNAVLNIIIHMIQAIVNLLLFFFSFLPPLMGKPREARHKAFNIICPNLVVIKSIPITSRRQAAAAE